MDIAVLKDMKSDYNKLVLKVKTIIKNEELFVKLKKMVRMHFDNDDISEKQILDYYKKHFPKQFNQLALDFFKIEYLVLSGTYLCKNMDFISF